MQHRNRMPAPRPFEDIAGDLLEPRFLDSFQDEFRQADFPFTNPNLFSVTAEAAGFESRRPRHSFRSS
jgi:hypothetical protein